MQFSIRHIQEDGLDQVVLKDEKNATEVALLTGYGATLHAFRVNLGGEVFNVVDGYKDGADVENNMTRSYKGPKLSPFPCRIDSGKYSFNGKDFQFEKLFGDGQAIHGLLADKPFRVLDEAADDASASVALEYLYKKEDPGYPYEYSCQAKYTLHPDNTLEVTTTLTNLDKVEIPIADGWHPYFTLGGSIAGWELQFHASAIVEFDSRLLPTGNLLQYTDFETPRPIGDYFLDNCFTVKPGLVGPACEIFNPANGLRVSFFPEHSYPYLQIYTPPTRDSIAVENLSSAPDAFNNKMGLVILAPGHSQIFTVRYKVSVG
jgi:aldose 1-epimerase